jgi:hypothetical protein
MYWIVVLDRSTEWRRIACGDGGRAVGVPCEAGQSCGTRGGVTCRWHGRRKRRPGRTRTLSARDCPCAPPQPSHHHRLHTRDTLSLPILTTAIPIAAVQALPPSPYDTAIVYLMDLQYHELERTVSPYGGLA